MSVVTWNRSSAISSKRHPHVPRTHAQGGQGQAELAAEERVLNALVGRQRQRGHPPEFRKMLREGELADSEIDWKSRTTAADADLRDIPACRWAQMGMINLNDMFGKAFGGKTKPRNDASRNHTRCWSPMKATSFWTRNKVVRKPSIPSRQNGIVFLDEIDKICARVRPAGADVSREGVQRDLLPLIEGTTVPPNTARSRPTFLFVASGAFHLAKPADLLPELQGRLPIRVELKALTRDDFGRILREPENSPVQTVRRAAGHRRGHSGFRRRRHRSARHACSRNQPAASRISVPGDCTPCWRSCWRKSVSPPRTAAAKPSTSPPRMCRSASPAWPRMPTSANSSCNAHRLPQICAFACLLLE